VIIEQSNHKGTRQNRATCFELFRQSTCCWVAKPPAEARFQISNSLHALTTTPDCKHTLARNDRSSIDSSDQGSESASMWCLESRRLHIQQRRFDQPLLLPPASVHRRGGTCPSLKIASEAFAPPAVTALRAVTYTAMNAVPKTCSALVF
jgi:hypothetical protein